MRSGTNIKTGAFRPAVLFVLAGILMAATTYLAWANHNRFKKTLLNQWQQQMFTTLEISSVNIENYFDKFSKNLMSIAENPMLLDRLGSQNEIGDSGYCCVKNLYDIYHSEVSGIVLLDNQNRVVLEYPDTGFYQQNFSEPAINESPMRKGTSYISDAVTGRDNKSYLFVSVPVYASSVRKGTLKWILPLDFFIDNYIQPLRTGKEGYLWLIDNREVIRSHHERKFIGISIHYLFRDFEITKKIAGYSVKKSLQYFKETKNFFDEAGRSWSGSGNIIDFAHNEYSLAVFRKLNLGDKQWLLVISLPQEEITGPVLKNAAVTFSLALFVTLVLTLLLISFYSNYRKGRQLEKDAAYQAEIARTAKALEKEKELRLESQINVQEKERNRISREIHDGLGQYLLAVKIKLEELSGNIPGKIKNDLNEIKNILVLIIEETKKISNNLMPRMLDEFNIDQALRHLCSEMGGYKKPGIDYVSYGEYDKLPDITKKYLFRIAQEGITNALKHAAANEINVQLLGNPEQITLVISDDGIGFDINEKQSGRGNGISNMKDRTGLLGGQFELVSDDRDGTRITVKIPLKKNNGKD